MRCGDGLQGGAKIGHFGSGPPLADGRQTAADSLRDGTVPGNRREVHRVGRGDGSIPRGTYAHRGSSSAVWRQSAAPGRNTGLCPPRTDSLPGPTRSTSGSPAAAFNLPEFRSCWRSGVAQCTGDMGPRLLCTPQRPPPIGCRAMPAQARGLLKCQHSYGGCGEKFARRQPDKWTLSAKQPRRLSSG